MKKTGTRTRWLPDLDVFTDIAIPAEYFTDVLRRQAVVNEGITFKFRDQQEDGSLPEEDFVYEHGIHCTCRMWFGSLALRSADDMP